jgi:phage gp45-like
MNLREIITIIRKELEPIRRRAMNVVSRGTIRTVSDSTKTQTVQVELNGDEATFPIEHLQPFGFSSVPVTGADVLHVSVGANRANGVAIAVNDNRYRPTGNSEGTVCLHTQNAVLVRCLPNNNVEIGNTPTQLAARADRVEQQLTALVTSFNAFVTAYNVHLHDGVVFSPPSTGMPVAPAASAASIVTNSTACDSVRIK